MERCPSWLKGHDWKSCEGLVASPRVRIPLSPQNFTEKTTVLTKKQRENLAKAIFDLGDKRAVTALIDKLKDEDYDVRLSAAEALGEIGDKQAIDPLIQLMRDGGL